MAEITSTGNVVGTAVGAVVGGTILVALAPVILPAVIFGGAAAAVTVGVGTVLGAATGWWVSKPKEETVQQLVSKHR